MMPRFRFTLGHLMVLIATSALLMANAMFVNQGGLVFYRLSSFIIECAVVGILIHSRRLSRWMWVLIAAHAGPPLPRIAQALIILLAFDHGPYTMLAVQTTLYLACSLLNVLGLAMTFRDIRRRLACYEDAARNPAAEFPDETT
ncbi:MAG: hypothetical protein ACP5XB_26930 [Isosphaeraceae bacterium]